MYDQCKAMTRNGTVVSCMCTRVSTLYTVQYCTVQYLLRLAAGAFCCNNAWLFFGTDMVTAAAAFYLVREAASARQPRPKLDKAGVLPWHMPEHAIEMQTRYQVAPESQGRKAFRPARRAVVSRAHSEYASGSITNGGIGNALDCTSVVARGTVLRRDDREPEE